MNVRSSARRSSRTLRRIVGPLAAVALLSSLLAVPAVAHNYNPFRASILPGVITSGGTVAFTVNVINDSQWYKIDKVTVVAPAGYTLVSPADGKFSGLSIAKNGGVQSLAFTATVPNGCLVTSADWKTTAKAGYTTFTPNPVTQTTQVANSCALAFVNQPATTVKAQSITSQAVNPAGAAVQVKVVDTANANATGPGLQRHGRLQHHRRHAGAVVLDERGPVGRPGRVRGLAPVGRQRLCDRGLRPGRDGRHLGHVHRDRRGHDL